jgi:ceramide glucosyltransferase
MMFAIWLLTTLFVCAGTWLAMRRPARAGAEQGPIHGVSVLKPLCGAEPGLEKNLESFFLLRHPCFELLFSAANPADPAVAIVKALQARYPNVQSRLFLGAENAGPNPKVNNMLRSFEAAAHDLILISDSNVRVHPGYLRDVSMELKEDVGVVTAVVAGVEPVGLGGRLEAAYLNTFYARGMNLAFASGNPCVIGKSMMFRRSVALKFGGLRALSGFLAEDYAMGEEMRRLGLKVVLMRSAIRQFIGEYSFSTFWQRHIRWGRIRKAHAPLAFLLEPVFAPLVSSVVAGFVFSDSVGFLPAFSMNLLFCLCSDLLLMRRLSGRLEASAPIDWLARELLAIPLWIVAGAGNKVNWRGNRITLQLGGRIREESYEACSNHSYGERQPAPTRWRATIRPATGGAGSTTAI